MSTINPAVTAANSSANSALQQAAQSIISGSTGNSSMDVNSLVTALVNAKTAGQTAALSAQQASDNTQISAYGALSAALSALQAGVTTLSNGSLQNTFTATAFADEKGLTPARHERFEEYVRRQEIISEEERQYHSDHPYSWRDHLRWYLQWPRKEIRGGG